MPLDVDHLLEHMFGVLCIRFTVPRDLPEPSQQALMFSTSQKAEGVREEDRTYTQEWSSATHYPYSREHDCQRNSTRCVRPDSRWWRSECRCQYGPHRHVS